MRLLANVLYITAHPLNPERSYSLEVGKVFIDSYKEIHPQDEVVHLDLYQADIPYLDADVFSGWEKLQKGERSINERGTIESWTTS